MPYAATPERKKPPRVSKFFLYFAGVAESQNIIGNAFRDHTSRPNGNIIPNAYPGENDRIPPDPHVVPNGDRLCGSQIAVADDPLGGFDGVDGGINLHVRCN